MPHSSTRRIFLGASAAAMGGLVAPISASGAGASAEDANIKVVTDFCAAWATRDMNKILPFLSDDCVYRMSETTPAVNGHSGVLQRLKQWVEDSSLVEFRILDVKASSPIVITHRIDRFVTKQPLTWEGVGVFFVKDGKIKEWSDYTIRVQR